MEGVASVDLMSYSCLDTTSTFDNVTLQIHNEFRAYHHNTSDLCINQKLVSVHFDLAGYLVCHLNIISNH